MFAVRPGVDERGYPCETLFASSPARRARIARMLGAIFLALVILCAIGGYVVYSRYGSRAPIPAEALLVDDGAELRYPL